MHSCSFLCQPDTKTGCLVWCGGRNWRGGRYGTMHVPEILRRQLVPGTPESMLVHRLALLCHLGVAQFRECLDVSHLCHNSLCCNPAHLVQEDRLVNTQRKICHGTRWCLGSHSPQCIIAAKEVRIIAMGTIGIVAYIQQTAIISHGTKCIL